MRLPVMINLGGYPDTPGNEGSSAEVLSLMYWPAAMSVVSFLD